MRQLLSSPYIRALLCHPKPSFDMATALEKKTVVLVNLAKGRIGDVEANLIGSLLIASLKYAAFQRTTDQPPFYLHVDEFQSFHTCAIADILSEARKY